MSTIALQHFKVSRVKGGGDAEIRTGFATASQNYYKGAPIYIDSNGRLVLCADDATAVDGIMAATYLSTSADDEIKYYPDNGLTIFVGNVYKTGDLTNSLSAKAQLYQPFALTVVSNKGHIDIADTGHDAIQPIALYPDDKEGDLYGRLEFTFRPVRGKD